MPPSSLHDDHHAPAPVIAACEDDEHTLGSRATLGPPPHLPHECWPASLTSTSSAVLTQPAPYLPPLPPLGPDVTEPCVSALAQRLLEGWMEGRVLRDKAKAVL